MKHLLVTNDFPPKLGGIQSYLWELWRRLPPDDVAVLTTPHPGAAEWDREQRFRVERVREPVLLPTPGLARRVDALAAEHGAGLVLLDPALPLGLLGPHLRDRYGLILHGAEVTAPGRLPLTHAALRRVLRGATIVVAAGGYPAAEAERAAGRELPSVNVPPGVDHARFRPLPDAERAATRERFGLPAGSCVVLGVSRLVPRKGFDVVIEAAAALAPSRPWLAVAIAGDGRDRARLERLARRTGAPAVFLGRVPDADLPALYGCADVFAMLCRDRWFGLEQEGFGIVFLEAAAAGLPQIAGASGGAAEAVVEGVTGLVVARPHDADAVRRPLMRLVDNADLRARLGESARRRVEAEFGYDRLAARLREAIDAVGSAPGSPR
jgi:phosphatidylinositol alpha-1,6-mannosyltransferase